MPSPSRPSRTITVLLPLASLFFGSGALAQTPQFPVLVNFQDPATTPPSGYLKDYGEAYGLRSGAGQGGLTYGWVTPGTTTPVDLSVGGTTPGNGRNRGTPADVRLATFMHMQAGAIAQFNGTAKDGAWEIAVPSGTYQVTVSVGDATTFDSVHGLSVEGVSAVSGFAPSSTTPFKSASVSASVSDGRLTLSATGSNTKLDYVDIRTASEPPPPPPTAARLALTRVGDSGGWSGVAAATDGDVATGARKRTTTGTEWIDYGLGAPYTLTRARLYESNKGKWNLETWQVQGWNGSAWVDLAPYSGTPSGSWNELTLSSRSRRTGCASTCGTRATSRCARSRSTAAARR